MKRKTILKTGINMQKFSPIMGTFASGKYIGETKG
jgi:hypothetical protein